jgi:uncharacterized protein YraI
MTKRNRIPVLLTLCAVFALSLFPVTGYAQEATGTVSVTPAGEAVNVRSGPGPEFMMRGTLYPGFALTATGRTAYDETTDCAAAWLRVDLIEGVEGWVNLCTVEVTGDDMALPVATPAYPVLLADMEALPELDSGDWTPENALMAAPTLGVVIVHQYPSLGSDTLGTIAAGEIVELLAISDSGDWVQIRYGVTEGWIAAFMVSITEEQAAQLPVVNLDEFFEDLLDEYIETEGPNGCQNPPPPWAMAHGWRLQCEGVEMHTYERELPPGQQRRADASDSDAAEAE